MTEPVSSNRRSGISRLLRKRFVRFLLVGGLNTVFGYGVFAAAILVGASYPIAALVSVILGILFNFKSYGTLVFGSRDNSLIMRFFFVYGICYAIGLIPLAWSRAHGVPVLWMAAICVVPMAGLAFTLQRVFVFRGRPERAGATIRPSSEAGGRL